MKTIFKIKKQLANAKDKLNNLVCFRELQDGRIVAAKWPTKTKKNKK